MSESPAAKAREQFKVMIVDDEPAMIAAIRRTLRSEKYEILGIHDGREALAAADEFTPDLTLLDLHLPGIDGFEVLRQIRSHSKLSHSRVIMMTGSTRPEDQLEGLNLGADDFLTKPLETAAVRARVRNHLRSKRLADDLERSYDDLRTLQQHREGLTQMLVHDFKGPLSVIQGSVDLARRLVGRTDASDKTERQLNRAHENCTVLLGMIQELLDIARLEESAFPLNVELARVDALLQELAESYTDRARLSENAVRCVATEDLAAVAFDRDVLRRVLSNLIGNSLTHAGAGATITLSADWGMDSVSVSVTDDGPGIPDEQRDALFDKFARANHSSSGQGLGLAFCRLAVEAHGGRIWAADPPHGTHGISFVIRLPLSPEQPPNSEPLS